MNACRSLAFVPLFPPVEPPLTRPVSPGSVTNSASIKEQDVTAVIGFCTKDGIVVATDSQATRGETKQCDSKKLIEVRFKCGTPVLIARAGSIDGADIFKEIFEGMAGNTVVDAWRTIADTVESALKQARVKILDGVNQPGLPPTYGKEHFESLSHRMLIAYMFKGTPQMFEADSIGTNAIKNTHRFIATGSGQNTAAFILTRRCLRPIGRGIVALT